MAITSMTRDDWADYLRYYKVPYDPAYKKEVLRLFRVGIVDQALINKLLAQPAPGRRRYDGQTKKMI